MNLADGRFLNSDDRQEVLDSLNSRILQTLAKERLNPQTVVDACDALSKSLSEEEHIETLLNLGYDRSIARDYLVEVKQMLSREYLIRKLKAELGEHYAESREYIPLYYGGKVREQIQPLGVLLHIAAGNADGLPVFSVIEGLLTGNINILKLPEMGDYISGRILMELIEIEPALSGYIYVFDYSSKDIDAIGKLIDIADGVVVWGGDAAVKAIRQMAGPDTKIIEWGHKISFAYVAEGGMSDDSLMGLAHNICETNQLLCSSCQGIFIDTDSMETVYRFCERFIGIMDTASKKYPANLSIGIQAQITLQLYNESLESLYKERRIFRRGDCSIIAYSDGVLEPGIMFRNCWVKPLPRCELLSRLRPYKNHLQTAALLCAEDEREELLDLLGKTGIVRITTGENMSNMYCGSPHDGEYPLRRYTKVVCYE
jgi:NAD-dependent aldehyde dehydrogenases